MGEEAALSTAEEDMVRLEREEEEERKREERRREALEEGVVGVVLGEKARGVD